MSKSPSSNNKKSEAAFKGITAISVRGYKSLYDECHLEIRPLTILAGANSSGKSSAMQPLLLLKQTLEASYDPGPLLLNGPNVRFTAAEQLFSRVNAKAFSDKFTITLEIDEEQTLTNTFKKHPKKRIELVQMEHRQGEKTITLRPGMTIPDILEWTKFDEELKKDFSQFYQSAGFLETNTKKKDEDIVSRKRCFLLYAIYGDHVGIIPIFNPSTPFEFQIRKLIHVPGLRGNPERNYKTTAIGAEFPGTFENYVASVINHWQGTEDPRVRDLGSTLEKLGLTWKVEARQVDDIQVELYVGRLPHSMKGGTKDIVSIADVGFGVSQILPVLVALLTAEPGQLVYLEQPEIHLHPRAQVALAKILADAANRGVRVVAETHSSLLLLGVQSLVAEGRLTPKKVKLHWFKRHDNGVTEVTSADLDKTGAFGDWPENFAEVSLETESRYLDAAEERGKR